MRKDFRTLGADFPDCHTSSSKKPLHAGLSTRELEVFAGIAKGQSIKEISAELGLSEKTVGTYLARIREKTGLFSHVDIARYALRCGLVS